MTPQILFNLDVYNLLIYFGVNILSIVNDKLLVSGSRMSYLFIYSRNGYHLSTITTQDNDTLRDASWTPHSNIVYTTFSSSKVVVMSESGYGIILHTNVKFPLYI